MTREMNKPDWHYEYIKHHTTVAGTIFERVKVERQRTLNPDIAEFFWATCERFKQC